MILVSTNFAAMVLMALSIVLWGSWANTYKAAGKWRFELYYFDFAFGFVAVAILLALTVGSLGFDGFSFMDDLLHAGKRQWFFAALAGLAFNFGNMLLLGSVAIAGMSAALPIGLGVAMASGTLLHFVVYPFGDGPLLLGGCAVELLAVVVAISSYRMKLLERHEAMARRGEARSTRRPSASKGAILAIVGGLLIGASLPVMWKSAEGELGLGPYSICLLMALAVAGSTFVFNLFLMNLPVEGEPLEIFDYFKGLVRQHILGWLGGGMLCLAVTAVLVANASQPDKFRLVSPANFPLAQSGLVVGALWGMAQWKELAGTEVRTKLLLFLSFALVICGLSMVLVAQNG